MYANRQTNSHFNASLWFIFGEWKWKPLALSFNPNGCNFIDCHLYSKHYHSRYSSHTLTLTQLMWGNCCSVRLHLQSVHRAITKTKMPHCRFCYGAPWSVRISTFMCIHFGTKMAPITTITNCLRWKPKQEYETPNTLQPTHQFDSVQKQFSFENKIKEMKMENRCELNWILETNIERGKRFFFFCFGNTIGIELRANTRVFYLRWFVNFRWVNNRIIAMWLIKCDSCVAHFLDPFQDHRSTGPIIWRVYGYFCVHLFFVKIVWRCFFT